MSSMDSVVGCCPYLTSVPSVCLRLAARSLLGSSSNRCPVLMDLLAGVRSKGFVKEASMELQEDVQRTASPCGGKPSASVNFDLEELTGSLLCIVSATVPKSEATDHFLQ